MERSPIKDIEIKFKFELKIENETDTVMKVLAQEIRNPRVLKEMQPECKVFRAENFLESIH